MDSRDPEKYLRDCTTIAPEVLEEEFVRTPADVAYWNAQYADALEAHLRAKAHVDAEWARLYLLEKARAAAGGEKTTEALLKASVEVTAEYREALEKAIIAEAEKARAAGRVDAVRTKKDMLQSLGAKLRAEMESDPMVRREQVQLSGRG